MQKFPAMAVLIMGVPFYFSACGVDGLWLTDSASGAGALASAASSTVDPSCFSHCLDKGESEDKCMVYCSKDAKEDCLEPCLEKGGSEEKCHDYCTKEAKEDCYEACIEKGESEEICTDVCTKETQYDCYSSCIEKGESEEVCKDYCEDGKKDEDE